MVMGEMGSPDDLRIKVNTRQRRRSSWSWMERPLATEQSRQGASLPWGLRGLPDGAGTARLRIYNRALGSRL